ncbi:MAG TPA: PspC domain-containing protein [Acidobacteriaceae bacterium]|nr:PspC domain-containing protein [Acidobacteriaceae bacterium]
MSAFCNNCGSALPSAARFCSVCGNVVAGFPPSGYAGYPPPGFQPFAPRLVRPIYGRQFAGVCIGLARTYGWDVGLVRIMAVIGGIFLFPFTEIVYIACWIGIPEELPSEVPPPPQP